MKKNLLKLVCSFVFFLLVITGCQKQISEPQSPVTTDPQTEGSQSRNGHDDHGGECRLTKLSYETIDFFQGFHYNNKGLADRWTTHYEDGTEDIYQIEYDSDKKLKKVKYYYAGVLYNTIKFKYTGQNVTKEIWYEGETSTVSFEAYNTYNNSGQMTKRETSWGAKTLFTNNADGNTPLIRLYIDNVLYLKYEYTYRQKNKNPWKAIPGIDYGFPYLILSFSSWWETSEKITYYEEGVPTILYAYDPSRTVMRFGSQHSLTSVFNYDYINDVTETYHFDYENCGRDHGDGHGDDHGDWKQTQPTSNKRSVAATINSRLSKAMLSGSAAKLKEAIVDLKKLKR